MASPEAIRKKSPRAPSISLDEALDRALKVYDKERLNPAPPDVVAQDMGYKDANNGRALATIASVRYYGLLERHNDGRLGVTKDVESYKYAPSEDMRHAYLRRFVAAPALFAELLDRYASGLPSDGNLRYELIQRDFLPATAENLVGIVKRSFDFARVYEQPQHSAELVSEVDETDTLASEVSDIAASATIATPVQALPQRQSPSPRDENPWEEHDRIPVRLSGGRRAWLLIPPLFREADKQRLKAQIDLLLTEDEDEAGFDGT
ncbi:hypothetical protein [Pigmentiphaga sp. NML030171]|uniref:hypothetical protein n=1 Tax=Pigmentiphaga sp. NML030171 TaxID=2008676 RepID=UPI001124F1AE|nr:hypothetical protein [Pigmentiphaga sp. NML030171]